MKWCMWQAAELQALEDDLHIKLGHQLFADAEYEQAMVRFPFVLPSRGMWSFRFAASDVCDASSVVNFVAFVLQVQFGMCSSANPVVLLRLFPSLAPEELLSPVLHLFAGALQPAGMR